jgi:hypothetical protein
MIGEEKLPAMSLVRMCEPLLRVAEIKTKGQSNGGYKQGQTQEDWGCPNLCRW